MIILSLNSTEDVCVRNPESQSSKPGLSSDWPVMEHPGSNHSAGETIPCPLWMWHHRRAGAAWGSGSPLPLCLWPGHTLSATSDFSGSCAAQFSVGTDLPCPRVLPQVHVTASHSSQDLFWHMQELVLNTRQLTPPETTLNPKGVGSLWIKSPASPSYRWMILGGIPKGSHSSCLSEEINPNAHRSNLDSLPFE